MENVISITKIILICVTFLGAVDYAMSGLPCENKFYSLETEGSKLIVYCNCDLIENPCEVTNCDNVYENIHKLDTYGCSIKDILLLTNIFKTIPANQVSMTTLLTNTVAHSTGHLFFMVMTFLGKLNNKNSRKFHYCYFQKLKIVGNSTTTNFRS